MHVSHLTALVGLARFPETKAPAILNLRCCPDTCWMLTLSCQFWMHEWSSISDHSSLEDHAGRKRLCSVPDLLVGPNANLLCCLCVPGRSPKQGNSSFIAFSSMFHPSSMPRNLLGCFSIMMKGAGHLGLLCSCAKTMPGNLWRDIILLAACRW